MDYPKVKVCLDTSEDNLIDELYTPCLKWAERFDRGVGYFTTGWLTYNVAGLSDFASRGGKMRLITSPILSTEDTDAIIGAENQDGSAFLRIPLVSRKSGIEKTAISKYLPFHKQLKTKYLNCVPRIGRILCRQVRVNGFIRT